MHEMQWWHMPLAFALGGMDRSRVADKASLAAAGRPLDSSPCSRGVCGKMAAKLKVPVRDCSKSPSGFTQRARHG